MFDGVYQPDPRPEPASLPIPSTTYNFTWLVAGLVICAICLAAMLGSLASDYVMG